MKNLLLISFMLSIAFTADAQIFYNETKTDAEHSEREMKVNQKRIRDNHIRQVKIYRYKSDTASQGRLGELSIYDERGRITEFKGYKNSGKMKQHYTYKYDGSDRMLEIAYHRRNGTLQDEYQYVFDAAGNETEVREYYQPAVFGKKEKLGWRSAARFDDQRNILEMKYFFSEGEQKLFDRYEFTYYPDGSKKQTVEYNKKGKARHKWNYDCNPSGAETMNLKDTSKICVRYETDKDGNKIRVKEEIVKYGKVARIVSKYDKNDNVLDVIQYDSKGRARSSESNTYDVKDNRTGFVLFKRNSNEIKERYVYDYDSSGNMTDIIAYKSSSSPDRIMKFRYEK